MTSTRGMMMNMRDQRGGTLVLVVGVVAALAILASAMVTLTVNVQHNTAAARTEKKAFNVAEAGLDAGQAALWQAWPTSAAAGAALTIDPTFRDQFDAAEFPDPVDADFIDVRFFDDDGETVNPGMNGAYNYDFNGNGRMWVVSHGATGSQEAKVQALVRQVIYDIRVRENVAIFTNGDLTLRGAGNQPVIGLDPPATMASIYAGGNLTSNGNTDIQGGIQAYPNNTTTTLQDVFPDEVLAYLIDLALATGKYYTTQDQVPAAAWSSQPRLIVIEEGGVDAKWFPTTDVDADGNATLWSEDDPGILICLSGDMHQSGQKMTIYGIVYLADGLFFTGNAEIHGMLIADDYADMRGTRACCYNAEVLANLNRPVVLSVKLVPNTWREIDP
jgi:type II secretory pathway pseudopilin PulG